MTLADSHILLDDAGVARIDGTRMKVIHLIKAMMAWNASPQQLHEFYPDLSLAQIHSALAYYYDHQSQLDAQIKREYEEYDLEKAQSSPTPGREKLRRERP